MNNPVTWAILSIRGRGVRRTMQVIINFLDNWWFDFRNGTDTAQVIDLGELDGLSDNVRYGHEYRASKTKPLRQLLQRLQLPSESVFVDFGCGKGKAIMIASEFPFQRLVGIEFSSQLIKTAHQNLRKFLGEGYRERIRVLQSDVVQYKFSDDENVIYFYNPFAGDVIESVLERLRESLVRNPRTIWILYFAPQFRESFDRCDLLELESEIVLGGADHLIYRHRPRRVAERTGANGSVETQFAFAGPVGEVLRDHYDRDAKQARLSAKFKLYYRLRPYIPIPLRQFLQRGRNQGIEMPRNWYLPSGFVDDFRAEVLRKPKTLAIHPWPDNFAMSVVLTHDVETKEGVALVDRLAKLEEQYGFRSVWNFIPYKYKIDRGLIDDLKARGHEIGIHGYNHDGRLFESRRTFERRTGPINRSIADHGSVGFRAPMVHRNLTWLQDLDVDYDASCFDVDPFQAMPGGVGGPWPFIVGKFVELPYTLPQDHTLLVSLGETTPEIWIEKLDYLRRLAGMALLITHPDYLDTPERLGVYRQFLEHLTQQRDVWYALPNEIAVWWRQRNELEIVGSGDSARLVGPMADRARTFFLDELQPS